MDSSSVFWTFSREIEDSPSDDYKIECISKFTPIESVNIFSTRKIFIKREDQQPGGSHKIRAACFQVSRAMERGDPAVIIPSSGNAAIAVATACRNTHIVPIVFLSPRTLPGKIKAVCAEKAVVILTNKPINHARYASRIFKLPNLRPSVDPDAVKGFMTLGFEIHHQLIDHVPDAVFIFSTSGASLLGIGHAFKHLYDTQKLNKIPELHCVQTKPNASIAIQFESRQTIESSHKLAGWGGAPQSYLAPEIGKLIRHTGGRGWIASDEEIILANKLLNHHAIHTSFEGAAVISAIQRYSNQNNSKRILAILTGKEYHSRVQYDETCIRHVKSYTDVRRLIEKVLANV